MQMICPQCGLIRQFDALPMRLQTCPSCKRTGEDAYLSVPALEARQRVPVADASERTALAQRIMRRRRTAG